MKSNLAILLTAILITGCDVQAVQKERAENYAIKEVCIDGVVYLIFGNAYKQTGGITPKINADFYPYTCSSNQK
ncbi:hypothetical protein [Ursidibacter sp. B-7004-1]